MFVVTFYSFKGGVGRTVAAANVGWSLANAGLQVLLVDFDLEAPGLTYLADLAPRPGERLGGVAELIADSWEAKQTQDPKNYIYRPDLPLLGGRLAVMPAGAVGTLTFSRAFSQTREFFKAAFGSKQGAPGLTLFRDLRRAWESLQFDYVLIDSRTGLTDIGGVCTRLLPDLLVLFLGMGEQGLDGVRQVLDQVGRETLYGDPLDVLLVASMVPEGEDALRAERLKVVEQVLGRRPNFLLPIFPPLFLQEDIKHIQDPLSPLAQAYRALQDQIRKGNKWDLPLRLYQSRLKAAGGDVQPVEGLIHDLLSGEADGLSSRVRWESLGQAAAALLQAPAATIDARLRAVNLATSALREVMARLDRYQDKELYAWTLNNLGNALFHLPAQNPEQRELHVREAVGYYKQALELCTRDSHRVQRAAILNNLANGLTELGYLAEAVEYYKEALELYTTEGEPAERATTLSNLANTLRDLPPVDPQGHARHLRQVVEYYKEALGFHTMDRYPFERATTLDNLATALRDVPARDPEEQERNYHQAVEYLKEALTVRTKDRYPVEWAASLTNLAQALSDLKGRNAEEQERYLREAVAHFKEALTVYTPDRYPLHWATTLEHFATVLRKLPVKDPDEKAGNVREAIAYYRDALTVQTKERHPLDWATTVNNLGNALRELPSPDPEERTRSINEAIQHYRQALQVRTRDRYPVEWAGTVNNLANALSALAGRDPEEQARCLREAVDLYRDALTVLTRELYPFDWAITLNNLAEALSKLPAGDLGQHSAGTREAIAGLREALSVFTRDRYPDVHAKTAMSLGILVFRTGTVVEAKQYLESAWALREFLPDQGERVKAYVTESA
jgi:tetratricopeptide (TPR) repeat protein